MKKGAVKNDGKVFHTKSNGSFLTFLLKTQMLNVISQKHTWDKTQKNKFLDTKFLTWSSATKLRLSKKFWISKQIRTNKFRFFIKKRYFWVSSTDISKELWHFVIKNVTIFQNINERKSRKIKCFTIVF